MSQKSPQDGSPRSSLQYSRAPGPRHRELLDLLRQETGGYLENVLSLRGTEWTEYCVLFQTRGEVWLVNDGERELGFYWIELVDSTLHLRALILRPEAQGQGFGRRILDDLAAAHEERALVIELGIHESNTAAMRLYRKAGFRPVQSLPEVGYHILQKPLRGGEGPLIGADPRVFDTWAPSYDAGVSGEPDFPLIGYTRLLEEMVRRARPAPGISVLDLGVGTGNLVQRFLLLGCDVWGLDFSEKMLEEAGRKLPDARLARADLLGEWPPEFRREFDRVVSAYALHHLDFPRKVDLLSRLVRTRCSAGGFLVVGDVSFPSIRAREEGYEFWHESWDPEEFYWAADETLSACQPAGLRVSYEQVSPCAGIYTVREA